MPSRSQSSCHLDHVSMQHVVAAADQLAAERDHRERVPRVAERGEQYAASRAAAQNSSANSRSIFDRASTSNAIGVVMSVPTPASR